MENSDLPGVGMNSFQLTFTNEKEDVKLQVVKQDKFWRLKKLLNRICFIDFPYRTTVQIIE